MGIREENLALARYARKAYYELREMGCPVIDMSESGCRFGISGERNDTETVWADYYVMSDGGSVILDEQGVNPKINKVLKRYGLSCEWYNPGVLHVFDE